MARLPLLLEIGSGTVAGFRSPLFILGISGAASGFPTQYDGLKGYDGTATVSLSLVATADAPSGMGGQLRISKGGTTYAVYLVDTTDGNASKFRIDTTTGTKSLRLKT